MPTAFSDAPEIARVACRTRDCERQNRLTAVHADTALPVVCGGCGTVLYCRHEWAPVTRREGTVGAPVDVTGRHCGVCGIDEVTKTPGAPVDLRLLPLSALGVLAV